MKRSPESEAAFLYLTRGEGGSQWGLDLLRPTPLDLPLATGSYKWKFFYIVVQWTIILSEARYNLFI